MITNSPMDTDEIKVKLMLLILHLRLLLLLSFAVHSQMFSSSVKGDSVSKVAEIELAEKDNLGYWFP